MASSDVLAFPQGTPRVSDHLPVSVKLVEHGLFSSQNLWRMDTRLISDTLSKERIKEQLQAMSVEGTWDELKLSWQSILVEAG